MRKRIFALVAACGVAGLAGPAFADSAETAQVSPEAANNPDRVVCQSTAAPTGTRLGAGRVCRTQRQWDDIRRQSQEDLSRSQMKGMQAGVPGH